MSDPHGPVGRDGQDNGLTHVALPVADLDRSIGFYGRYAGMVVVHRRTGSDGTRIAWLSDRTRPFVIVLLETEVTHTLGGWAHLGVGVSGRAEVDRLVARARADGLTTAGPHDDGPPVGYWAIISDPDGHHLEVAHGQEVGLTVEAANPPA